MARWSGTLRPDMPGAWLAQPLWLAGMVLGVPALVLLVISLLRPHARPSLTPPSPAVELPKPHEAAHIKLVREALDQARCDAMRRVKRDDVRHGKRRADK